MSNVLSSPADEVHVWFCPLDLSVPVDVGVLDEAERKRAESFQDDQLRNRWLVGRVHLRQVLARYLDREPAEVSIVHTPGGKPELAGEGDLVFSRSASGEMGAVAVARGGRLGIDIEAVEADIPADGFADWVFTAGEGAWVHEATEAERQERFLRLWTAKEAMVKADGDGMAVGLTTFEVEPTALSVLSPPSGTSRSDWNLASVDGPPGFVCTVARLGGQNFVPRSLVVGGHGEVTDIRGASGRGPTPRRRPGCRDLG